MGIVAQLCLPRAELPRVGTKPAEIAQRIRIMIIEDVLPPGTQIRERALAEQLQVSRTPLREALKILVTEGLVDLEPRRSAVVARLSDREVRELLQLLGVLEGFAAELACAHVGPERFRELRALQYDMLAAYTRGDRLGYFQRNQDIHRAIVAASGNQALVAYHARINARVYRVRYVCNLKTQRWESAIREHQQILEALERGDAAVASALLRGHVLKAWDLMTQLDSAAATATPLLNNASISASA
jgi:DNA-binding GntR family transcriptional regulator